MHGRWGLHMINKLFDIWIYGVGAVFGIFFFVGLSASIIHESGGVKKLWDNTMSTVKEILHPLALFFTGCMVAIIGISDAPYIYYQILRWVVCGIALLSLKIYLGKNKQILGWLFIVPAVLFNPLAPFYLSKGAWVTIDVAIALFFTWVAVFDASEIVG